MTMQKQPEGLRRVRKGEVVNDADGKPVPADTYDILTKDKTVIGHTRRAGKAKGWYAIGPTGLSLQVDADGLWEPYRTHGLAMHALAEAWAAKQSVTEPEPVRSDEPTVTEEERIEVILVDEPEVELTVVVEAAPVLTEQEAADLHTQLSEEIEVPLGEILTEPQVAALHVWEGLESPQPPAAPLQSQAPAMDETDDWLTPAPSQQLPAGGDDELFQDPFAAPAGP